MGYVRGIFTSACIALGGAGGGVIAMAVGTHSPRLMTAGILSAVIGILAGGVALEKSARRT